MKPLSLSAVFLALAIAASLSIFFSWQASFTSSVLSAESSSAEKNAAGSRVTVRRADATSSRAPETANRMSSYPTLKSLKERAQRALAKGDYKELQDSLPLLTHVDPAAACALAESAEGYLRSEAIQWVVQSWAEDNPDAAVKWAAGVSEANEQGRLICFVCDEVAKSNPEAAIALLTKYRIRADAIAYREFATKWATEDFDAAKEWAAARPPGDYRSQIFIRLATEQAKTDPENAVRLLLKEIPSGPRQSEAAIEVVFQWASRDHAEAAAWVATFPPGELKQKAEQALAGVRPQWWNSSKQSWD